MAEGTEVGLVVADRMKSFRPKAQAGDGSSSTGIKRIKSSRFGMANVLRVFPPVVEFHGIEVGTLYVMTLTVQNTGNTVRRVRFQAPRTSAFRIKQKPAPGLAPGLDTTVDVEFFAESEEDFHDKLIVTSGSHAIEVPLHAFAPAPKITFDGFVDLGLCVLGQNMARYIEFKNEGMTMGEFNIEYDENLPITITPNHGVLHPSNPLNQGRDAADDIPMGGAAVGGSSRVIGGNSADDAGAVAALGGDEGSDNEDSEGDSDVESDAASSQQSSKRPAAADANNNGGHFGGDEIFPRTTSMKIKIEFHGEDLGAFRGLAKVRLNGQPDRILDINAMLVEQRLELVIPEGGGQVATLPFGTLHFGMEKTFTTLLVNNGPVACAYSVGLTEGDREDEESEDGDTSRKEDDQKRDSEESAAPPVIAMPADGIIQPYQQIPIVLTFAPTARPRKTGWAQNALSKSDIMRDYHVGGVVQCVDTSQKITFTVTGRGVLPQVELARDTFDFGHCPVHGRRDILTTIINKGEALPVKWSIPRVAHFDCKPQSGTLHPGQSAKLLVTFRPAQLGQFKHNMLLKVEDGTMEKIFRVLGHADRVDKSLKPGYAQGTKVGGPTSIPADFKPKITFVDESALNDGGDENKPWRRVMPWEETFTNDQPGHGKSSEGGELTVADSQYTFSVPDLLRRQAHRDQYHAYLRDAREHRLREQREKQRRARGLEDSDDPNSVDMGMRPRAGLMPPVPKLPQASDPLWLEQPLTEDGGPPRRRVKIPSDEKRLIKNKFKPRATTPAEVRDVDCELTAAQLRDLSSGPTSLNFGRVVVHSISKRSFFVANNLSQSVLVAIQEDALDEELQRTTPLSQLIPPGELAGFDIAFSSRTEQNYRRTVQYMVNDRHNFKFNVAAEVVPITLQLSTDELNFRFAPDSLEPTCTETIVVKNPGNAPCTYKWSSGRGGVFMCSPKQGTIDANSEENIVVTWQPVPKGVTEDVLRLQVAGGRGEECKLKVAGEATHAKLLFKEKRLELGGIAVGMPVERTIVVKMAQDRKGSGNQTAFYAESTAPGVTLRPDRGFISPGQSRELTVVTKAPREHQYNGAAGNSVILCRPRGGMPAVMELMGEAVVPEVHVLEEEIEFGGTTIGATMRQPLRLENRGSIPAVLFIDLERHPEFTVEMDPVQFRKKSSEDKSNLLSRLPGTIAEDENGEEKTAADEEEEEIICSLISVTDIRVGVSTASTKGPNTARDTASAATTTKQSRAGESRQSGRASQSRNSDGRSEMLGAPEVARKFKATIPVGKTIHLLLVFAPQSERSHVFELPLILAGQHQRRAPESLQRVVSGEGLRPRVYLSKTTIDFGERVVSRDPSIIFPYHMEFTLTNRDEVPITWEADTSGMLPGMLVGTALGAGSKTLEGKNAEGKSNGRGRPSTAASMSSMTSSAMPTKPTFTMAPDHGDLEPGEARTVKVSFWPDSPGEFEADMPIFLDGDTDRPYITLRLKGEGIYPKLSFDVDEVVLPPVPLGIPSRARFEVINTGYDQLELEHVIPLDSSHVPLEINYPEGIEIGMARDRVPVEVVFNAPKAMAFTCKLDFLDADGNRFTINVTGAAENCLLTTQETLVGTKGICGFSDKSLGFYAKPFKAPQLYPNEQVRRMVKDDMKAAGKSEGEIDKYEMQALAEQKAALGGKDPKKVEAEYLQLVESPTRKQRSRMAKELVARQRASTETLRVWLNASVMKTPIERIPHDFVASDGKPLFSLIEMLTGRAVPKGGDSSNQGYPGMGGANKRNKSSQEKALDAAKKMRDTYHAVLAHIKSHGALVNHVRPEILLKRRHFVTWSMDKEMGGSGMKVVHHMSPSQQLVRKRQLEREWKKASPPAWASILYQVVKCYILNRITPSHYQQLPGVDHSLATLEISEGLNPPSTAPTAVSAEGQTKKKKKKRRRQRADPALVGSNVYSVAEGILLKWLTYHYTTMAPSKPRRVVNFDSDLRNGTVLGALLQSHVPALATQGRPLFGFQRDPTTEEHIRQNAERIVAAMRDLGLDLPLSPAKITAKPNPDARDMLLLVLYLYQNLPQYLPKTTIDFECVLGQTVTKSIELRNPSKSKISYFVTIEGSPDFSIEAQEVDLEPLATISFPVEFTSRFSSTVSARLMFRAAPQAGSGGGASAATMVFELKSAVHSRRAMRTVNVEARCYESSFVELEITNPYKTDGNFKITLTQDMFIGRSNRDKRPVPALDMLRGNHEQHVGHVGRKKGGKKGGKRARKGGATFKKNGNTGNGITKKKGSGQPGEDAPEIYNLASEIQDAAYPMPFWCRNSSVKVKAGQAAKLMIQFLPMQPGNFRCQVVLLDEKVGECMYEVLAVSENPAPTDTLKIVTEMAGSVQRVMKLNYSNPLVEKARATGMERYSGSNLKKMRDALKTFMNSQKRPMEYSVEFDSPFFNGPTYITCLDIRPVSSKSGSTGGGKKGESNNDAPNEEVSAAASSSGVLDVNTNAVMVQFAPQQPGEYPAKLVLRSPLEVRVFDVLAVVKAPQKKRAIDFEAPAREVIVQDIPIVNRSETDWTITASIRGEGSHVFQGGKTVKIPKGSEGTYKLKYKPDWVTSLDNPHSAQLTLSNATTGEDYVFDLKGTADEPLALDHVVIPCQARQRMIHKFRVKNSSSKPMVYSVESDLTAACGVSGLPTLEVPARSSAEYELVLRPLLGGTYNGSVTFTAANGSYQWYTVEVDASPASPEQTLDLTAAVRRAVSVEIALENPLKDEAVDFDIALQGEGLLGDATFSLGPGETATYELLFAPLLPGREVGSIVFANPRLGEVWYELNLVSKPPERLRLQQMRAAVGTRTRQGIYLENPSNEEITLMLSSSNTLNFRCVPNRVTLGPYGKTATDPSSNPNALPTVEVEYAPSSLDTLQEASIVVKDPRGRISDWEFMVSGRGDAPSMMEPVMVYSAVKVRASSTFSFRNPFPEPITVKVTMRIEDVNNGGNQAPNGDAFTLLLKHPYCKISAFGGLQVPFIFVPTEISEYGAIVEIEREASTDNSDALRWTYPIRGVAEALPSGDDTKIVTQARDSLRQIVTVPLRGLSPESAEAEQFFGHELIVMDDSQQAMVARSINVVPEGEEDSQGLSGSRSITSGNSQASMGMSGSRTSLGGSNKSSSGRGGRGAVPFLGVDPEDGETPMMFVSFVVDFLPLKAFKAPCELVVNKSSGGRWRHGVVLESTEPEVDDVIVIEALLNSTSSVSFKLTNQYASYAPFTASFTPDSPYEFTVFPNEGVLEPPGRGEGTVFIVSFTPTEYGKTQIGKLVIQTEEMQWSYEIRGIPPEYKAPEGTAVVASRMDKSLTRNLGKVSKKTNYLRSNMDVKKTVAMDRQRRAVGKGRRGIRK